MLRLSRFNLLKALSPVAMAASIFLATEIPANAVPHISLPSRRNSSGDVYYRHRQVYSPSPLNITPPTGRHTPLPRSSRSYYYRSRDYRGRDRYRSRRNCRDEYRGRRRYRNKRHTYYTNGYRRRVIITPVFSY